MYQVFDTCVHTIRTLPVLQADKHDPEDVDSAMEDHLYDALRYGLMSDFARSPAAFIGRRGAGAGAAKKYDVLEGF